MLKVSIVDDELDIRNRLSSLLSSIDSSISLLASYENGIDAYNGVTSNPPDLLITDIRIPYINGIELIRQIKQVEPFIKIIIITGYDELDYAKQAIELDVIGFISKPIGIEDLAKYINKAKEKISQEYELYASLSELHEFQKQNLAIMRENDLCKVVSTRTISPNFYKQLLNDSVNLAYEYIILGVFDFDNNSDETEADNAQITLLSIKQNLEKEFRKHYDYETFNRDNQLLIIIKSHHNFAFAEIDKYISYELLRVKKFLNVQISAGFSDISLNNHDFKQLFLNAKKALELRKIMGGGKVYFYDSIKDKCLLNKTIDDSDLKRLTFLIKYNSIDEVQLFLDNLKSTITKPEYHSSYYFIINNILAIILLACDDLPTLYNQYLDCYQIYKKLGNLKTVDETFDWFLELAKKVKNIDDEIIIGAIDFNMQRIKDYLETHYTDFNLNLDVMSDKINLSTSYISTLLKKQCNLSFVKYLTMLRMEKAKQLLNNSSLKIVDISEQVGYSEPYYFSHCFKKYFGVSPKEYRSNENYEKVLK